MNPGRILLLGSAFALSAFIAGCGATGDIGGDAEFPISGGHKVRLTFKISITGATTADVGATTPLCLEVCFTDEDGALLDCVTLQLPGSTLVPAGSVGWEASVVDCPTGGESAGGGGADGMFDPLPIAPTLMQQQHAVPFAAKQWDFLGGNVFPIADGSRNVSYSFRINAPSIWNAKARRDVVLAGGIGTPVGLGFDVVYYNESEAEFDSTGIPTGVRMRQAEVNGDFTTFRLVINGLIFAELGVTGNLLHYGGSNQWNVVETFVPTSAFDTSPGTFDNQSEADWSSTSAPVRRHAMQRVYAD